MNNKERRKYSRENPIKSGSLIGEMIVICICVAMTGYITYDILISRTYIIGLFFVLFMTTVTVIYAYVCIYKPVKALEEKKK